MSPRNPSHAVALVNFPNARRFVGGRYAILDITAVRMARPQRSTCTTGRCRCGSLMDRSELDLASSSLWWFQAPASHQAFLWARFLS